MTLIFGCIISLVPVCLRGVGSVCGTTSLSGNTGWLISHWAASLWLCFTGRTSFWLIPSSCFLTKIINEIHVHLGHENRTEKGIHLILIACSVTCFLNSACQLFLCDEVWLWHVFYDFYKCLSEFLHLFLLLLIRFFMLQWCIKLQHCLSCNMPNRVRNINYIMFIHSGWSTWKRTCNANSESDSFHTNYSTFSKQVHQSKTHIYICFTHGSVSEIKVWSGMTSGSLPLL